MPRADELNRFYCPLCRSNHYHLVTVKSPRDGKPRGVEGFYRCAGCSVMFGDAEAFMHLVQGSVVNEARYHMPANDLPLQYAIAISPNYERNEVLGATFIVFGRHFVLNMSNRYRFNEKRYLYQPPYIVQIKNTVYAPVMLLWTDRSFRPLKYYNDGKLPPDPQRLGELLHVYGAETIMIRTPVSSAVLGALSGLRGS